MLWWEYASVSAGVGSFPYLAFAQRMTQVAAVGCAGIFDMWLAYWSVRRVRSSEAGMGLGWLFVALSGVNVRHLKSFAGVVHGGASHWKTRHGVPSCGEVPTLFCDRLKRVCCVRG